MEMGLLYKMVLIDLGLFNMDYESFFLCCNMLNMVGVFWIYDFYILLVNLDF